MSMTIEFDFQRQGAGDCTECQEPLDDDRQTITMRVNDGELMQFHQVCAWKRATFIFGELF